MKKFIWLILAIIVLIIIFSIPGGVFTFITKILAAISLIIIAIALAIVAIVELFHLEFLHSFLLAIFSVGLAIGLCQLLPVWF